MTYEELLQKLDDLQTTLPKCANAVLLRLVAKSIALGSNEIEISARDLATELNLSRDAIRVAAHALRGILTVHGSERVSTRWVLSADWFSPQRSLFTASTFVENRSYWPGNQARGGRETRPEVDEKPGQCWTSNQASGRVTRPRWTDYQASLDEKPGQSGLITRPALTQNQQLTGGGAHDRSIDTSPKGSIEEEVIDRVVHATKLPEHLVDASSVLSEHLRGYAQELGPPHLAAATPDETILARCFAIAPLGELISLLRQMHRKGTRTGDGYAWFVAVFANRIHRIRSQDLRIALQRHSARKPPGRTRDRDFGPSLVNQATAGLSRMS